MRTRLRPLGILVAVLVLGIAPAHAQGLFIDTGFGLTAGVATTDGASAFGFAAGYAFTPVVDAGVTFNAAEDADSDRSTSSFGAYVGVYPVRQSASLPVSVRVGAAAAYVSFAGDAADALANAGIDIYGTTVSLSATAFHRYAATPDIQLVPAASVIVARSDVFISDDAREEPEAETATGLAVEVGAVFGPPGGTRFAAVPRVVFLDGETTVGISLTILFPRP